MQPRQGQSADASLVPEASTLAIVKIVIPSASQLSFEVKLGYHC